MKVLRSLAGMALIAGFSASSIHAQAPSPQLTDVLKKLDAAAATFRSAEAEVSYDIYTRVVRDHSFQTGTLYIEHTKEGQKMGALIFNMGPDNKPEKTPAQVIGYDGKALQAYSPGTGQDDVYKAGPDRARNESFLTLAFGSSGSDLAKSWTIQDMGSETLNDGTQPVKTEKLDLVSKDADFRNFYTHVTIWVDLTRGVSLKQIFYAPNGDSRTTTYSKIRLNKKIDTKPYEISKDAQRILH
jgi:outer membrane lipoprotein-sorting protein